MKNTLKQVIMEPQTNNDSIIDTVVSYNDKTAACSVEADMSRCAVNAIMDIPIKCPTDSSISAIACRGEYIHNISIIFYNRAYEWFRGMLYNLNKVMNTKIKKSIPRMYQVIISNDRDYCDNEGEYPFIYHLTGYRVRAANISPAYPSTTNINEAPYLSISAYTNIIDLCVFERYINLDIDAIKSSGLALSSTMYNELLDIYYSNPNFNSLDCFGEYKTVCGEVIEQMLNAVELMIEQLYREAHIILETQDRLFTGPYATFDQVSSAVIDARNQKISAFIKNKVK